jgi:hypothetical protein
LNASSINRRGIIATLIGVQSRPQGWSCHVQKKGASKMRRQ